MDHNNHSSEDHNKPNDDGSEDHNNPNDRSSEDDTQERGSNRKANDSVVSVLSLGSVSEIVYQLGFMNIETNLDLYILLMTSSGILRCLYANAQLCH